MTLETTSRKHQRKVDLYCARRDDTMLDILFSGVIAWDCRLMNKMQKGVELLLRYKSGSGVSAYYSSLPCWTIPPSPEKDPRPSISHFSCTYALDTSNRYSLVPHNPLRLAQISFRPSRACYLSDGAVIMHTKPPNGNSTAHKMSATTPRSSSSTSSSLDYTKSAFKTSTTSLSSSTLSKPASSSGATKARALWTSLKKHMREHHESVNAVYENLYGHGYGRRVMLEGEGAGRFSVGMERGMGKVRWTAEGKGPELWVYQRGVYGA
jgi:hypothetical protein